VFDLRVTDSDGRIGYVASTMHISKWLTASGAIYLVITLIFIFFHADVTGSSGIVSQVQNLTRQLS
jgi:hypothetical protein